MDKIVESDARNCHSNVDGQLRNGQVHAQQQRVQMDAKYLVVIGSIGQHHPEDQPNTKQMPEPPPQGTLPNVSQQIQFLFQFQHYLVLAQTCGNSTVYYWQANSGNHLNVFPTFHRQSRTSNTCAGQRSRHSAVVKGYS
eukprot:6393408-Amphidinium_carterae.1